MQILSEQELVRIWEAGYRQHSLDQAMTILMAAFPGMLRGTLAELSIGQRDACLLAVRRQTFGAQMAGLTTCPACQEQVEFVLNTAALPIPTAIPPASDLQTMAIDMGEMQFRLPNSLDLAAIVGCRDAIAARHLLAQRCIVQVVQDGKAVSKESLPETLITLLADEIEKRDPLAEIRIDLNCPTCRHQWKMLFDIVSYFWTEIAAQAKRLLRDVHTLARAYGWREADILSMSSVRRKLYLEMVT
jgi:T4 bacteriophage base plate protein